MAKFPSQRKIMYAGATVSNGAFAQTHLINLPKDLSIMNRRGYGSTTNKGVPLIFRVAATVYPSDFDGAGYVTSVSSDVKSTVKFLGVQNNWVTRNAAVKWHAARNNMWKKAGVKKKDLGAYSGQIRYAWNAADNTFAAPVDGNGAAYTGGTWDLSTFVDMVDNEYKLALKRDGTDEDSAHSESAVSFAYSYLSSRATVPADSNLESSETPAAFSHLVDLLSPTNLESGTEESYIRVDAQTEQDNPPYEMFATETTQHDITEPCELGRLIMLPQGSGASLPQTVMLDIPFGIMEVQMCHRDPGDNSGVTDDLALSLEVTDIFEMQG